MVKLFLDVKTYLRSYICNAVREYAHGSLAALAAFLPRRAEPRLVSGVTLPRRDELGLRMRESAHVSTRTVTLQYNVKNDDTMNTAYRT